MAVARDLPPSRIRYADTPGAGMRTVCTCPRVSGAEPVTAPSG
jgi:hypothetical protein